MSEIERVKLSSEMRINLKKYILIKRRKQQEESNVKEQKIKIKVKIGRINHSLMPGKLND